MSVYVVGERLGRGGTRAHLARLLLIPESEMMSRVVWVNLWEHPGTTTDRYVRLIETAAGLDDVVIMLGRRVADAFGLRHLRPLEHVDRGSGARLVLLPHPSGRNRWYNDPDHEEDASVELRGLWRRYGRDT